MGKLDGKVVFVSGAARGQGRSHAVRLAEEGASIIAFDICDQIPSVFYEMSRKEDLDETVRLVRQRGGQIVTQIADVRDLAQVQAVYQAGVTELGPVDIVLANAGIMPTLGADRQGWYDAIDVMLSGVFNVIDVAVRDMIERGKGGSIVITSSTAGLSSLSMSIEPGMAGYVAAKHGVVGLMRMYAAQLAPHSIRVNTVHPTGVNTPMVVNPEFEAFAAQNPDAVSGLGNPMPVDLVEAIDISNAIVFLTSDDGRYVTGVTLPIDAGFLVG